MKRSLPIDQLLTWALVDELPKGHPVSLSTWDAITSYGRLGTRPDVNWGGSDGFGFVQGTPHPDAERVAAELRRLPKDTKLSLAECEHLIGPYAALDPLALRAVAAAPFNMVALLIHCAVLKRPMEWDIGLPQARVMRHEGQRHAIVFGFDDDGQLIGLQPNRMGLYRLSAQPRAHVVYVDPTVGRLLEVRAEYAVWHRALLLLRDQLADLAEHAALPPSVVAEPWHGGQPFRGYVFKGRAENLAKLPLRPIRPATARPYESDIERKARQTRAQKHPRAAWPKALYACKPSGI